MLPDDFGIRPLVANVELYEISPPPGNNGVAVSGAAPCPLADGTQSNAANDSNTHCPQKMRNNFLNFTIPPVENGSSTRMRASEPTGLDTEGQDIGRA
jgi:hypothetical protein